MKPTFPFGNIENPVASNCSFGETAKDIYNDLKKKGARFGGFYVLSRPVFITVHPEIVRSVLAKDFR